MDTSPLGCKKKQQKRRTRVLDKQPSEILYIYIYNIVLLVLFVCVWLRTLSIIRSQSQITHTCSGILLVRSHWRRDRELQKQYQTVVDQLLIDYLSITSSQHPNHTNPYTGLYPLAGWHALDPDLYFSQTTPCITSPLSIDFSRVASCNTLIPVYLLKLHEVVNVNNDASVTFNKNVRTQGQNHWLHVNQ